MDNDGKSRCIICGDFSSHPFWKVKDALGLRAEGFVYFQCSGCGCLQIKEAPANMAEYYHTSCRYELPKEKKSADPGWKRFLRRASVVIGTSGGRRGRLVRRLFSFPVHHEWLGRCGVSFASRILDVGCGDAGLLVRMRKEGFVFASGIEPFAGKDIFYEGSPLVRTSTLVEMDGGVPFDFILMNHSLEHIPDQLGAVRQVARLLRSDGVALIRIPVSSSYAWEHYGIDWSQFSAPKHLYFHSEKSMILLAGQAGLKIREVVYDSKPAQFYGSEMRRMGYPCGAGGDPKTVFSKARLAEWKRLTKRLNTDGRGDFASFYLTKQ